MTKHYFIYGRVQGVGFRAFTRDAAAGLLGWVRNLPDGRVEAVVRGSDADLARFESELRRGLRGGHVDNIDIREGDAALKLSTFQILREK